MNQLIDYYKNSADRYFTKRWEARISELFDLLSQQLTKWSANSGLNTDRISHEKPKSTKEIANMELCEEQERSRHISSW